MIIAIKEKKNKEKKKNKFCDIYIFYKIKQTLQVILMKCDDLIFGNNYLICRLSMDDT
jgi:putative IMPACT (imprinted ancient) family translation regulator